MVQLAKSARDWLLLAAGWIAFAATGRTPAFAYQSMVRLFCSSGGRSNDLLSSLISVFSGPYRLPGSSGVLGNLSLRDLEDITARLDGDGYFVSPARLSEDLCARLTEYALNRHTVIREDESVPVAAGVRVAYASERNAPRGVRYDFDMADVVANPDVQKLLCDLSFLSVAQSYLRARPVADVLGFWWNTAFNAKPSSAAAQYFHFDFDRVKWLKIFIYLTDVGPEGGPHTFVAGSHRTGGIPRSLLQRGYVRLSDEDVRAEYPDSALVEFSAPRGTILIEDTRGLHKGRRVERGDRLILQLQFSNSLFGATYPKSRLPVVVEPPLRGAISEYPSIFSAFL